MGLLSNLLSGAVGAGLATVGRDFIKQQGGIEAIAQKLQQHGLGETVQSWIGTGKNLPISADQIQKAFGSTLEPLAAKFGVSPQVLQQQLAKYLPKTIDKMTPQGTLPGDKAAA